MKRRDFLKSGFAVGLVSLGGLFAYGGLNAFNATAEAKHSDETLNTGRWGLVVDIEKFNASTDFASIVAACHKSHNVPSIDDPKTEVKWIWQDDFEHCFPEMTSDYLSERVAELRVPVLCNHCEDPACVKVCPTQATFQRPDGIVDMDYHRCIGCRFCMTACPYNARSLNFCDPRLYIDDVDFEYPTRTKGVVEKCTFCVERLTKGLSPLCAEESNGAIIFGDLDDPASAVRKALETGFSIRRRSELGTGPSVYYLFRGGTPDA
ncbi:MAG: 4Fe-4S dicluster domain-containing protein [Coriobacteriales bacterium]|jgi:molybdopterin-containing oxidoreductase family iron-sulfur binding subunit|nr:4Fe-4S dicluster domain-containing protein [Coriobacteriales bacterium]